MCDKNPVCGTYSTFNDVWSICDHCKQSMINKGEQCFYALLTLYMNNIENRDTEAESIDLKAALGNARKIITKHGNIMPEQFKG